MKTIFFILAALALSAVSSLLFYGIFFLTAMFGEPAKRARAAGRAIRAAAFVSLTIVVFNFAYIGWAFLVAMIFRSDSISISILGWVVATWPHTRTPWNSDTFPTKLSSNLAYFGFWLGSAHGVDPWVTWAVTMALSTIPMLVAPIREELTMSSKELREAVAILDEVSYALSGDFNHVRERVEREISGNTDQFLASVRKGRSVRKYIFSMIANVSGDMAESGQYHIYRGVLNPMGPGKSLIQIYDFAMEELVRLGDTDEKNSAEQKAALRKNIEEVG